MGQMARARQMRREARETDLGEKSLYKSMRARASPEFHAVVRVLRSLDFPIQVRQITLSLCRTRGTLLRNRYRDPTTDEEIKDVEASLQLFHIHVDS